MATFSSILTQRIPWTEEPGGLQSIGLQKSRRRLKWVSIQSIDWTEEASHILACAHAQTQTHTHTHCPHRPVYEKNHGWPNSLAMSRKNKLAKVAFHPPVPVTDCIKHIQTIMGLYIKRFSCLIYHKFRANQTGMRRTLEFFFFFLAALHSLFTHQGTNPGLAVKATES